MSRHFLILFLHMFFHSTFFTTFFHNIPVSDWISNYNVFFSHFFHKFLVSSFSFVTYFRFSRQIPAASDQVQIRTEEMPKNSETRRNRSRKTRIGRSEVSKSTNTEMSFCCVFLVSKQTEHKKTHRFFKLEKHRDFSLSQLCRCDLLMYVWFWCVSCLCFKGFFWRHVGYAGLIFTMFLSNSL